MFQQDKITSIKDSLKRGQGFLIFCFHSNGKTKHIVGCVLFLANRDGIYVNWLAINRGTFSTLRFGAKGSNQVFRECGFGTFLLVLVQMRSAILEWSTDIYLQANQSSPAVGFYKN